jgi:hypothetical protein
MGRKGNEKHLKGESLLRVNLLSQRRWMHSARRQKKGKLWGVLPFQLEGTDGTKGPEKKRRGRSS